MNVLVITRNLADMDRAPKQVVIDHDNPVHRTWLGRHCFWAFRNNHSIFTCGTNKPVTFVEKSPNE